MEVEEENIGVRLVGGFLIWWDRLGGMGTFYREKGICVFAGRAYDVVPTY